MSRVPVWPTRRVVLTVPALALPAASATACSGSSPPGGLTPTQVAADIQARARTAEVETALIARYDAALALPAVSGNQALAERLAGVRAEHAAHLAALREGLPAGSASATSPRASQTSTSPDGAAASSTPPNPPKNAKTVVGELLQAERDAATRLTADVLTMDGHTAQLLASISASESGHAALLLGAA